MNLIDLLEVAGLKQGKTPVEVLVDIELDERIDKEVLAHQIIVKCGAMCPVFNTSWSFTDWHKHWFEYNKRAIKELCDTLEYEYIPIESYSRYDDLKHESGSDTGYSETNNRERTDVRGNDKTTKEDNTSENQTSAYNESLYQPESKSIYDGTVKENETENINVNEGEERNYKRKNDFNSKDDNYVHGNNGLFTVQHLIEEQRELVQFNVMDWIVQKYMKEGFLLVY